MISDYAIRNVIIICSRNTPIRPDACSSLDDILHLQDAVRISMRRPLIQEQYLLKTWA
jgi:hypothetical protein